MPRNMPDYHTVIGVKQTMSGRDTLKEAIVFSAESLCLPLITHLEE